MKCHNTTSHITEGRPAVAEVSGTSEINGFRRIMARNEPPKKWEIGVKFPTGFPTRRKVGNFPFPNTAWNARRLAWIMGCRHRANRS